MIGVVTDSTAQVPPDLRDRLGIRVVPCGVAVAGEAFDDSTIAAADVAERIDEGVEVTTSAPPPGVLSETYAEMASAGAAGIVSVHVGSFASSTVDAARLAARRSAVPVEVVDTESASFGTGLCAWAAAVEAAAGGSIGDVVEAAARAAAEQSSVFVMDVEAALRGGRIDPASAAGLAPADGVPVLALGRGQFSEVARVATTEEAAEVMAAEIARRSGGRPLRVGVGEIRTPEVAEDLISRVEELPEVAELVRYEVAASVVVHSGTRSAGAFFVPA